MPNFLAGGWPVVTARPLPANFLRGLAVSPDGPAQVTVQLLRVPASGTSMSEPLWDGDNWIYTNSPGETAQPATHLPATVSHMGKLAGTSEWTYTGLLPQPGSHTQLSLTNGYYRRLATVRDQKGNQRITVTTFRVNDTTPYLTEAASGAVALPVQSPAWVQGTFPIATFAKFPALSGPEDPRRFYPRFLRSDNAGNLFAGNELMTREDVAFGPLGGLPHPVIQRVGLNGWREREFKISYPDGVVQYGVRWSPSDVFTSLPPDQAFPALSLAGMETDAAGNCYAVCRA